MNVGLLLSKTGKLRKLFEEALMSHWQRFHLEETIKAMATPDNHRFFIQVREPPGQHRKPIEFYRWTLKQAQEAADRIVQAYYPHECEENTCGNWKKLD